MNRFHLLGCSVASVLGLAVTSALAQEAASLQVAGFEVTPELALHFIDDSNIYQNSTPESALIRIVSPSVSASIDNGISGFSLGYTLTQADYSSRSDENYTDHLYETAFGWQFNEGNRLMIKGRLLQTHDTRGADAPSGRSAPELDKYEDTSVDARYDLGRESTRLRLHLNAEVMAREYTTNPSTTRIRDRSQTQLGGRLSLRMLDRLSSRVQLSSLAIDYDANNDPGGRRDSNETSYTLGFSWQISSQFDIDVDAGKLEREFDSPRRRGFSTSSWDVELNWSPLDRSAFGLLSSRSTEEPSSGNSDVIVRTRTGVSWSHEWSSRLRSSLAYSRGESEYKGSQREDDTDDYSMDVNYQFRRWLGFGLNAQYLEQRSTDVDYDRTQLGLNVLITL